MTNLLRSFYNRGTPSIERSQDSNGKRSFIGWLFRKRKNIHQALDKKKLDDIIDADDAEKDHADERFLIANILNLDKKAIEDVMIPRANITSIDSTASLAEVHDCVSKHPYSRYPVYREHPDEIIGILHARKLLCWLNKNNAEESKNFFLHTLLVKPLFVAPSMRILDLLLHMREACSHMAMVVDEYGGIDGLVTMEDLVENIIGDIRDEHDNETPPKISLCEDGSLLVDARLRLEAFEQRYGLFVKEEERNDIDTLGGLIFSVAGRVPRRGEVIVHPESGLEFGLVDADPRRIHRLRVIFPQNRADADIV